MVESQYRLMKDKFGIDHVVAVVGPLMGGALLGAVTDGGKRLK